MECRVAHKSETQGLRFRARTTESWTASEDSGGEPEVCLMTQGFRLRV